MTPPETHYAGGYYVSDGAQRSRLYLTPSAAPRAWERGERYTAAEYAALTTMTAADVRRKVTKR